MSTEKFTDYIFTPLDIPKFNFDKDHLLDFFEQNKSVPNYDYLQKIENPWFVYEARRKEFASIPEEINGSGWDPSFKETFPQIVKTIEGLPFQYIERVYFLQQKIEVQAHRDVSREKDESLGPSTFRCPIINEQPESTFYLSPLSNEEFKFFPKMPLETQWFGMNNYNAKHGSFLPTGDAKKLMLCVWGQVEPQAWFSLLERSINKYEEYCFKDSNSVY